ncbi:hypothetical protein HanPI659440_Chr08g0298001 [Helianthus annuus]|nr:hypothetical protein HanPI659440_Chr08g0297991 [Helianthus annuus]KAJ0764954.1 hypothetical protein HanPI659440_Chr08g0298001 [Helianthus annuus]
MEDPESEWKIQEYSSSEEDDEDDKPTVVRRILSNGYVIGKEFVITGIFISSAPLVVPPLVVVSAIGYAFTVPFGVLFASYACTNKIMSMLLPTPSSPLRLEYYSGEVQQEDDDCKLGLGLDVVVETNEGDYGAEVDDFVTEREDNELVEDVNQEVHETEMVFELGDDYRQPDDYGPEVEGYVTDKEDNELVEDVNQEVETEIVFGFGDDYRQEGETSIANVDEDVDEREMEMEDDMLQRVNDTEEKEREPMEDVKQGVELRPCFDVAGHDDQGYEEDAGEYLEGNDDGLEEEPKGEVDESESDTQEVNEDAMLRDEGWVDNTVEDDCIVSESASDVAFGDVEDVGTTIPVTSGSASNVVFGDVKDVGATIPVTSGSASDVDFGDAKDVETTKPFTSGSASNVVFDDVKDVETTKSVTNESVSDVVFGDIKDVETTKQVTSESASDVVSGDVKDVGSTKPITSENAFNVVFGDDTDVETTEPVTVIEIESEKLVEKGSKNDEPVGEMRHVVILSDGNEENNFNSRVVDELDLVAREVVGDANEYERSIESDEKVLRESMGTQENNGGDASTDGSEDAIMRTMEEHLIHSNADAQEIGEENNNLEVGNEVKENAADDSVKYTDKENAADDNGNKVKENVADDVLERTPSKHNTDNAKVVYKKMPSREDNLDDEKIWEKIGALRTIVGYQTPSQPTCIGELKALYVFTGVEPPASFDGDSDLDAKLKFLMAIVGVK